MKLLARIKNGIRRIIKGATPALQGIYSLLVRFILLPVYKQILLIRLRVGRLFSSVREAVFFMFTNRYIFHGVLGLISIGVIVTQLQTKPVSAYGAGQRSLLYTLVTKGQPSFIEETVRPELVVQDSHYLGADTIDTSLGIDFQYEASVANVPLADTSIPGAIALQPGANEMQVSGQPPAKKRTKTETYVVQQGEIGRASCRERV